MERPSLKSVKDIKVLAYIIHLEKINDSAYKPSYISLKMIVDSINSQIQKISIDITSDDGEKQFKLISKYASQLQEYSKQLDFFKSKMLPEEIIEAEEEVSKKLTKEDGVEDFLELDKK